MMNCKTIKKLLPGFIDGKLSIEKEQEINNHLINCSECSLLFEKTKNTLELLKPKNDISEQAFYYTRLKQKIENKKIGHNRFSVSVFLNLTLRPIAYAASLALAVYIGILIGSGSSKQVQLTEASVEKDYIQTFAEYQYLNDFKLEKIENVFTVDNDTIE